MNMQQKILGAIKEVVEAKGYEWVQTASYANVGVVYIQKPKAFGSVLGFHYDFQDSWGTCRFSIFEGGHTVSGGSVEGMKGHLKTFHRVEYTNARKIEEVIEFFNIRLTKVVSRKPRKKAKDDISTPLRALLRQHMKSAGTDMSGAVRDAMTVLIEVCGDEQFNAEERFQKAFEVFDEHREIPVL